MPSLAARLALLLCSIGTAAAQLPRAGLLCDLDASRGVHKDANNLVYKWENQAVPAGHPGRNFIERTYANRPSPQGRPAFLANRINGRSSLAFRGNPTREALTGDDLINMDGPDVYDHLIQGAGYTWIAVIRPYRQISIIDGDDAGKDINILFGNLKNGDHGRCQYCGFWGGVSGSSDRPMHFWAGNRGDDDFSAGAPFENQPYSNNHTGHYRTDGNPHIHAGPMAVDAWEIVGARMESGIGDVWIEAFLGKDGRNRARKPWRVYPDYDASEDADMLAIGTERDAIEHPGLENFDGEFARFLIWERPLEDAELRQALAALDSIYFRKPTALAPAGKPVRAATRAPGYRGRYLDGRALPPSAP